MYTVAKHVAYKYVIDTELVGKHDKSLCKYILQDLFITSANRQSYTNHYKYNEMKTNWQTIPWLLFALIDKTKG